MAKKIAIVGAGTSGLHLGLRLRQCGIDATIFTDRRPEEYADMRLMNTVAHHAVTIAREEQLGVNHWPNNGYLGHYYYIGTQPDPLEFYGSLSSPSRAVDYRIYQPRLMQDFLDRGGRIEYRAVQAGELAELAAEHDLVVVCTGKGSLGRLFPRDEERSPFTEPERQLCVGLFKGIAETPIRAVTMYFSPGSGEMIEIPTLSFGGMTTALVFENHPGADLEILTHTKYDDDPRAFLDLLLEKIQKHYPTLAERINPDEFDLANGPLDVLQGAFVPTVRQTHLKLENGKIAVAVGDVHALVDPVLGQGANAASYGAWVLADEIQSHDVFDERFCELLDLRRQERVLGATRWTNFMLTNLRTLPPELAEFIGRISQDRALSDKFTDNFNHPNDQWDCFATPERTAAWIDKHASRAYVGD